MRYREAKEECKGKINAEKLYGTAELGEIDRGEDGDSTRRRRRCVIVLKQKPGQSLNQTLITSPELKTLGLSFNKGRSPLAGADILSPKSRRIVLKRRDLQSFS